MLECVAMLAYLFMFTQVQAARMERERERERGVLVSSCEADHLSSDSRL